MAFAAALVNFTSKDEREHPKFMKLLERLRSRISADGTSLSLRRKLDEARKEAEAELVELNKSVILKQTFDTVMIQRYKVEGGKYIEDREAFLMQLQQWYNAVLIQECAALKIAGFQIPDQPPVNVTFVKNTLLPLVEEILQEQTQDIIQALAETACSSADKVDEVFKSLVRERKSLQQEVNLLRLEQGRNLNSLEEVLKEYLKLKLAQPVAKAAVAAMGKEARLVTQEMACTGAKMSLLGKEMYSDTYSARNVETLKYIRKGVQKKVSEHKRLVKDMQDSLSKFSQLNPRVREQVDKYGKIREEISRLKKALHVY